MSRQVKHIEKNKAIALYLSGTSQKKIAIELNVTEKTVGVWLKETKARRKKYSQDLKILGARFRILVDDPNSNTQDIKNLAISIERIENIWYKEIM
ncbi:hypothetical protein N4T20_02230 [Flavobacterium sp. TR2]|uniref:helix-turn-helix domain-containing protein n=1 Tax=Flavobacterium sp. TR2 TaxID=2977321 RepID=UPI0021B10FD0|nr:hypothetical protein [Flavobacterium sp. TR2]UWY28752.1 hypothetical protein N4T20_02230 [Flavobacterium sp. TR2]